MCGRLCRDPRARRDRGAAAWTSSCSPRRQIEYRGATLEEFDLDAALARRPQLILVDELAHTNAPGSRHPKRWQDVEELLEAGIDVYTTVNVQHIESLNDVVAQITGVIVRETVPDRILEQADEVELIDLTPDDLLQRLREGKVYLPQQAERAVQNFFRKGNLIALRELALRRTADRVDAQMQHYRRDHAIAQTWPTTERLLVCVSPGPLSVAAGARGAAHGRRPCAPNGSSWRSRRPKRCACPKPQREQLVQTLAAGRAAGRRDGDAERAERQRDDPELRAHPQCHQDRGRQARAPALAGDRVRLDRGRAGAAQRRDRRLCDQRGDEEQPRQPAARAWSAPAAMAAYGWGVLVRGDLYRAGGADVPVLRRSQLIMVYLLGIVVVATRLGRGPSILASVLSVAAFDFFFVPPFFTFAVSDVQYLVTFAVMLVVALVISTLTTRISARPTRRGIASGAPRRCTR